MIIFEELWKMILKYRILCNYDIIIEDLFKIGEEKMDKTKFYTNRKNIVYQNYKCLYSKISIKAYADYSINKNHSQKGGYRIWKRCD